MLNVVQDQGICCSLHEKHAIAKPRQALNLPKTIWEALACRPLARDCSEQAEGKRNAVEQHMDAVAEQPKRVGYKSVEGLDQHKSKVQTITILADASFIMHARLLTS